MPHLHSPGLRRRALPAALLTALAGPLLAADLSGRWEGELRIPGAVLPIVIDLAPPAAGGWAGSVTLPGRGVKGAPLEALQVGPDGFGASLETAFGGAGNGANRTPTRIDLRMIAEGSLAGEFQQGGHRATATLRRSGPAQVDLPRRATAIDPSLAGTWTGRYELGGSPRDVTLTLVRGAGGVATGTLKIVGRRTTELALDRVMQTPHFIELDAGAAGIRIEGRWQAAAGRIDGSFTQGPFEAPLSLQRQPDGGRS